MGSNEIVPSSGPLTLNIQIRRRPVKLHVLVASVLALAVAAPVAAHALTIDNQDKTPYTVKVKTAGAKTAEIAVKAGSTADVDCKAGCTLKLGKLSQKVDAKATKVMIKDGKLVM